LRVTELNSRQKRNEISTLSPELGLRDIPGNSVQRRRRGDRRITARVASALPLIEPPRREILGVARAPLGLLLRTKLSPTLGRADAVTFAYARVNTEPVAALRARTLLRHVAIVPPAVHNGSMLEVDCFSRASPD
jgi:hypothetical protein